MQEATFDELWTDSRVFRNFFIGNHGYFHNGRLNWDKAVQLWADRYPLVSWKFCGCDGCKVLVSIQDRHCAKHSGNAPKWRFYGDTLWKLAEKKTRNRCYRNYLLIAGEKIFGEKFPSGYRLLKADGNPFNYREKNLRLLSRISIALVNAGIIFPTMAVAFDKEVLTRPTVEKYAKGMISRTRQMVLTYGDVARVANRHISTVHCAVSDGILDFDSLESIFDFIIDAKLQQLRQLDRESQAKEKSPVLRIAE